MANYGLLSGLGQGMAAAGEMWMKHAFEQDKEKRLQEIADKNYEKARADKLSDYEMARKDKLSDTEASNAFELEKLGLEHQNKLELASIKDKSGTSSSEASLFNFYQSKFPDLSKEEILSIVKQDKSPDEMDLDFANKVTNSYIANNLTGEDVDPVQYRQSILTQLQEARSKPKSDSGTPENDGTPAPTKYRIGQKAKNADGKEMEFTEDGWVEVGTSSDAPVTPTRTAEVKRPGSNGLLTEGAQYPKDESTAPVGKENKAVDKEMVKLMIDRYSQLKRTTRKVDPQFLINVMPYLDEKEQSYASRWLKSIQKN